MEGIIVEYSDGEVLGVELGTVYGIAEGSTYPHEITTGLKVGDKVKKGDIIAFNTGFFEQDIIDPKAIVMKTGIPVRTALYESNQTFEDSSAISKRVGNLLTTKTVKVKEIVIEFNQSISDLVKIGSEISPDEPFMIIEDEITSNLGSFSDDNLKALKRLSGQVPKSKYKGTISEILVLYNGDKNDMSSSLRKLANRTDKSLASKRKSSGRSAVTGNVNSDYRVSGKPLQKNSMVIKILTTVSDNAGVGDKGVFANQLKSVFGEVMDYEMRSEKGLVIDAVFGYRSIAARIVNSPVILGTTITLLKVIAAKAVEMNKG